MYRVITTEGNYVMTETFCDKTGLELYLENKDFPMVCAATIKELHDTGKVPEITVDGVTINITYSPC